MSRLDELIAELCPDGVEYKKISEIADTNIGLATSVSSNKSKKGVQLLHNSDIQQNKIVVKKLEYVKESFAEKNRNKVFKYHDLITVHTGDIGTSAVIEEEYVGAIGFTTITTRIHNFDKVSPYYLCHYLNSRKCKDEIIKDAISDRNNLNQKSFDQLLIPLPPLPKQLYAELTAELSARKKKYEYYRKELLKGNAQVKTQYLEEVANVFRGEYITKKESTKGSVPVILGGQEPAYYIDKANHFGEVVVVARSGASAGFVSYWNEPIFITDGFGFEAKENVALPKYLYYTLKAREKELNAMKRGAGVPHVSGEMLAKIKLPIPSVEEQVSLVSLLDKFDTICNDLSSGIPAEIAARQKQYEYYRDKLLTFKELQKS